MNESIDHLYRRGATERANGETERRIFSAARAHARAIRVRRRLGIGVAAAAAVALFTVGIAMRRAETGANDALRAHYQSVARPYLLVLKLQPATGDALTNDAAEEQ